MSGAGWVARIPEQAPAYVRAATLCGGVALIGVFGPDWLDLPASRERNYGRSWDDAAPFFAVLGLVALGLLAAAGRAAHRAWAGLPAPAGWWSSGTARLLAVLAMGLGVGAFLDTLACVAGGDPLAFAWLACSVLTVVVAGSCERGLASIGLVALGVLVAAVTVFVRGYEGWNASPWRRNELFMLAGVSLAFVPLLALLVQGLLSLTQRGASAGMHGLGRPAHELARRGDGWVVRVEAPGLAGVAEAKVALEGRRLVVGFTRLVPPAGQVLFQGRARGQARVVVLLPAALELDGAAILEHGLLTVPLRRRPEEVPL